MCTPFILKNQAKFISRFEYRSTIVYIFIIVTVVHITYEPRGRFRNYYYTTGFLVQGKQHWFLIPFSSFKYFTEFLFPSSFLPFFLPSFLPSSFFFLFLFFLLLLLFLNNFLKEEQRRTKKNKEEQRKTKRPRRPRQKTFNRLILLCSGIFDLKRIKIYKQIIIYNKFQISFHSLYCCMDWTVVLCYQQLK